ncbi:MULTISPECIES: hypothetical protein [Brenneria]|uniref:Holin n=2 Tax=Brenneria nigrifluens DSM 30175 = ATCC 13028 TaxID=1121120 RepID=A0ABX5V0A6_9GAMM|nr:MULTISPECIES: hypothetical protein [Brenneria]EHD22065.1 hypothetical protein BrE312_2688 [Brenneria sp. EniD312]QCR05146.1 hypothetical protein EH206_13695 [Brenneria nigrifluens DSM 30175 = ATCC 13028]
MKTSGSSDSYFWSWMTGFLTTLSTQDVIFAIGAVFTAIFTVLTYLSNSRKNKAIAAEARRQTEILLAGVKEQSITPKEFIAATKNIKGGADEHA